ncbi:MAG TPA: transcription antitermination factor NusB [Porticoccaceae bacterium]|nr:transcription antitermination factor NusB [Porticoccaceae bacterium]HCO60268.1 transcription antitermination factor NusB [Porticoccaceae bacterium]
MAATPSQRRNARQALVQALYQWQLGGDNLSEIETQFYSDDKLKKADKAYFSELLHAIPASADELDGIYGIYLDRSQSDLDPVSLAILRIATYELAHRVDLPYKVVINEAVNLAKTFGPAEAHKFINGIVDRVAARVRQVEIQAAKSQA